MIANFRNIIFTDVTNVIYFISTVTAVSMQFACIKDNNASIIELRRCIPIELVVILHFLVVTWKGWRNIYEILVRYLILKVLRPRCNIMISGNPNYVRYIQLIGDVNYVTPNGLENVPLGLMS